MTDNGPQSTALAARPVREVRLVEDVVDVLDTARFEQMQRISSAMAAGSLIPDTLRGVYEGSGNARKLAPFEEKVVVANIFRVVEQAVRWGMSPFAVIDCASVVHGRLMWEGKLVHAVVEARCGVRLNHRFGRMVEVTQASGAKVMKFDPTEEGPGELLAVQTYGTFPGEDEERTIEGTVAQWKTTGNNSPWGSPANWKRQLRYRGSREWARAHSSAVMLGVITNDEMDDDAAREVQVSTARRPRAEKADIRGKLTAPKGEGFSADHVDAETAARTAEAEDQRPEDERASDAVIEGSATTAAAEEAAQPAETPEEGASDGADGVTHDHEAEPAQTEEESIEELKRLAYDDGFNGEPVQAILSECDSDEERAVAAKAHEAGAAARVAAEEKLNGPADPDPADEWAFENVGGAAPKGEVYLLSTDEPNDKGRLQTYRDGQPHSTVGTKGAAALKAYDGHPEPADPALASQGGGTGLPADETPRSALFKELAALPSWLAIKPRLSAIYGEDDFKALTEEDQAAVRASLFPAVLEMKDRTRDPVDWATDVSCFVLWLDHTASAGSGKETAEAIEGTFAVLQDSAGWGKLNDGQRTTIEARVSARTSKLRGA